ncbi:hypothetical protein Tco_0357361 [Tanacetum coccineum]
MLNTGVDMISLYMRCSMDDQVVSLLHEDQTRILRMVSLYMKCSTEERDDIMFKGRVSICIDVHEMFKQGVGMFIVVHEMLKQMSRDVSVLHEMNESDTIVDMRCSTEESRCIGKIILDVNFLWKEELVHLLVGSPEVSTTPSYSSGPSTTLMERVGSPGASTTTSYSLGPSMTSSYSPGPSTTQIYSLRPSTSPSYSPGPSRNAESATDESRCY